MDDLKGFAKYFVGWESATCTTRRPTAQPSLSHGQESRATLQSTSSGSSVPGLIKSSLSSLSRPSLVQDSDSLQWKKIIKSCRWVLSSLNTCQPSWYPGFVNWKSFSSCVGCRRWSGSLFSLQYVHPSQCVQGGGGLRSASLLLGKNDPDSEWISFWSGPRLSLFMSKVLRPPAIKHEKSSRLSFMASSDGRLYKSQRSIHEF